MTKFKVYYKLLGGHVHCKVYAGPSFDQTMGKAGDLTFRRDEWMDVIDWLGSDDCKLIPNTNDCDCGSTLLDMHHSNCSMTRLRR